MLRRAVLHTLLVLVAVLSIAPATAQTQGDEFALLFTEFDARGMSAAEKRYIQAGLAFEGDYRGPLDGVWEQESQRALESYVRREFLTGGRIKPQFIHAFAVLLTLRKMVATTGWGDRHFPDLGLSLAAPWGLLKPPDKNALRWETKKQELLVDVFATASSKVFEAHNRAENEHTATSEPYLVRQSDRLVSSVRFASGGGAYVRSDRLSDRWISVLLLADDAHYSMLNVTASGIHFGPPRSWRVPERSLLATIRDLGARYLEAVAKPDLAREPAVGARPSPQRDGSDSIERADPDRPAGSGTGFYVTNTELVTAAHVIAGCEAISLQDGTRLKKIATDEEIDLAVLSSPIRSQDWLPLGAMEEASLGERVYVLGFPYYGLIGTSLHATTGSVSALTGLGDNPDFISISAPVQPGSSGGPIFNHKGEILGVVSARLSQLAIAEATGSLPQNMNYAVTGPRLVNFLKSHGVSIPRKSSEFFNMEGGTPDFIQRSITPILCW